MIAASNMYNSKRQCSARAYGTLSSPCRMLKSPTIMILDFSDAFDEVSKFGEEGGERLGVVTGRCWSIDDICGVEQTLW